MSLMNASRDDHRYSILIVEDDRDLCAVIRLQMDLEGWEAECADGARNAAARLKERTFDLILSDVRMPDGNGRDLLLMKNELYPKTPIILMSGFSDLTPGDAAKMGSSALLYKPFEWQHLSDLITSLINRGTENAKR